MGLAKSFRYGKVVKWIKEHGITTCDDYDYYSCTMDTDRDVIDNSDSEKDLRHKHSDDEEYEDSDDEELCVEDFLSQSTEKEYYSCQELLF